jgi:hypothetical protein
MNDTVAPVSWLDANQRYLCAEFARLKARLGRSPPDAASSPADPESEVARARDDVPGEPAIDTLAVAFGLTPFERELLLLCAAVEMDAGIATLCAGANGRADRGFATFGMALATLRDAHWSALSPVRPLRRWRLIEVADGPSLVASPLRIDERVLHYLAGINALDARLQSAFRVRLPAPLIAEAHRGLAGRIARDWERATRGWPIVQLCGDDRDGQEDVAARAAADLGWSVYALRSEDLPATAPDRGALATLWTRESTLLGAALLIDATSGAAPAAVADFIEAVAGPVFVATRDAIALEVESRRFAVVKPGPAEQKRLWRAALGPMASRFDATLDVVAGQFRLSAQAITRAGLVIRRGIERGEEPGELLRSACAAVGHAALDDLAQRIEPAARWDDLVLPEDTVATLREIAAQVRHRETVYETWGFAAKGSRGLGITTLFTGESGTGKTMAAEVLASDLGLDLYRIDLSTVVSKYIGETEKNLRRVFDAAEDSGAILLFDEADALFGKRSEVKDSHDRYANIEVSYLLQRMEAYRGLAILTTNAKSALDRSFQRRLRFVVQFPFPDAVQRERIWRNVFPAESPVTALDYRKLARLNVSGGAIRNIAMNAAFRAVRAGEPVAMAHLECAARNEYAKAEKTLAGAETKGWT